MSYKQDHTLIVNIFSLLQEISGCNADGSYGRNCGTVFGIHLVHFHEQWYTFKCVTLTRSLIVDIHEHLWLLRELLASLTDQRMGTILHLCVHWVCLSMFHLSNPWIPWNLSNSLTKNEAVSENCSWFSCNYVSNSNLK
jgi:hypothetical protein